MRGEVVASMTRAEIMQNLVRLRPGSANNERDVNLADYYARGSTLQEVAAFYALSQDRVKQILYAASGGRMARLRNRKIDAEEQET